MSFPLCSSQYLVFFYRLIAFHPSQTYQPLTDNNLKATSRRWFEGWRLDLFLEIWAPLRIRATLWPLTKVQILRVPAAYRAFPGGPGPAPTPRRPWFGMARKGAGTMCPWHPVLGQEPSQRWPFPRSIWPPAKGSAPFWGQSTVNSFENAQLE